MAERIPVYVTRHTAGGTTYHWFVPFPNLCLWLISANTIIWSGESVFGKH